MYVFDDYATSILAISPIALLFCFGLILSNEPSHAWLVVSMMIRGTNSVKSHVWRTASLVDYPRVVLLIILILGSIASTDASPIGDMLGLIGAVLGGLILLCNLGSRAWKKLELGYVDSGSPQSMLLVIGASPY